VLAERNVHVKAANGHGPDGRSETQDKLTLRNNRRTAIAFVVTLLFGVWLSGTISMHTVPANNMSAAQTAAAKCKLALLTGGPMCKPAEHVPAGPPGPTGPVGPQLITMVLNDGELSVLANQRAQAIGAPVDNIVVHAKGNNQLEGTANGHVLGQTVRVYFHAQVNSPTSNPTVTVTSVDVPGVPGFISAPLLSAVGQALDIGTQLNLTQTKIAVGVGTVSVSGYR
jgi:hypothetical protein